MSAIESIMRGLNEALDHARKKEIGARVHRAKVPSGNGDGDTVRASTDLSQDACARGQRESLA